MSKLASAESLTQDGYTLGTPEYMAPEQCIGATVDPRTDLYAFGVLMYEALTGELPIRGRNRRELLELHQREIPRPMRVARPDLQIPEALDAAVMLVPEEARRRAACIGARTGTDPDGRTERGPVARVPGLYDTATPGTIVLGQHPFRRLTRAFRTCERLARTRRPCRSARSTRCFRAARGS